MAARTVAQIQISDAFKNDCWEIGDLRTSVESLQFIARNLRSVHAIKHRLESCIFFTPEVVGNYDAVSLRLVNKERAWFALQDMETVGPSATVPGIVADVEPRPAFAHKQSGVWWEKSSRDKE